MIRRFFTTENSNEQLIEQRRDFLKLGLIGVAASAAPLITMRDVFAAGGNDVWKLSFRHAHTGESFSGVYRVGDKYLPEAFERLSYVMRDFRTGEVFPMDPHVIDILSLVHKNMNVSEPFHILSGYRSPKTNAMLKGKTRGVANNSFHMYGQAVDIRIPGQSTRKLRNTARELQAGGVGYYSRSNFIHVDTGDVRSWSS